MKTCCFAFIASLAGAAGMLTAQKIQVVPAQAMVDQTASVIVTGLAPGSQVTIRAEQTDGAAQTWVAQADFAADSAGSVDTSRQAPLNGSYRTVSALGLVWSMRPKGFNVHLYEPPHNFQPQPIQFRLLLNGQEASSAQFTQLAIRPDVQQINVNGIIHGVLFLPGDSAKHPGVLVVVGSEGGYPSRKAAWLASHGYAAFALCYFHCAGTPDNLERIPLEYFSQALSFMMKRPEVDPDRLAVMGTSRGGELALQLGSMYSPIKAVVAYVPANVRHPSCCEGATQPSWTWHGAPLTYISLADAINPNPGSASSFRAQIAVEAINGPILMIGAEDDGIWPSAEMVRVAAQRLRSNHFSHQVVTLIYPHAGHRAGLPDIVPAWTNGVTGRISGRSTEFGGSPEGNAESSLDATPKVLDFLATSLADHSPSTAAAP
jgi:dienelactone hydrolase